MENNNVRIVNKGENVCAVAIVTDEAIARETLTLDADITSTLMGGPALLKVKAAVTTGNIKVDLAGGTAVTFSYADVNEANLHVTKVYKTGTTLAITDFYLYQ
jgi:hypothetical protein